MNKHPLNLLLRFILELVGLWALGYWGFTQHAGLAGWLWGLGVPLLAATLWGVFRVDNEPGKAPVKVPGWVRLLLEVAYFGGATGALYAASRPTWGLVFGLVVLAHYALSWDRYGWLLRQ